MPAAQSQTASLRKNPQLFVAVDRPELVSLLMLGIFGPWIE
jgi:hypothetical protein